MFFAQASKVQRSELFSLLHISHMAKPCVSELYCLPLLLCMLRDNRTCLASLAMFCSEMGEIL